MKEIKLAVFDMAGTTVNEDNLVYKTLLQAILKHGFECTLDQVLAYGAGKEKLQAIYDTLEQIADSKTAQEKSKQIFEDFKLGLETAYNTTEVFGFENVETLFSTLRENGIKVVLNTGYDSKTANTLLNKLNWEVGREIDGLVTASDVVNGRPHPDMIHLAMEKAEVSDSQQVLKAGDSAIDIMEGKNANCGLVAGVLTGAQTKEQLLEANPDYILDQLTDLQDILIK
ncbi:phosphonatase-like hydrolase [Myroides sp. LJL115]